MLKIISSKETNYQWLQDPSEINGDNLKNVGHETSRHFRKETMEYLKARVNELATTVRTRTSDICIGE
jgi:hypothetical protein